MKWLMATVSLTVALSLANDHRFRDYLFLSWPVSREEMRRELIFSQDQLQKLKNEIRRMRRVHPIPLDESGSETERSI